MDSRSAGLLVISLGLVAILVGLLSFSGALAWFGRLPGDIRVETPSVRVYIPITSMLLVSLVLTGLSYLLRRLF
jgi:Protein of unknown function (DUF2905)